MNRSTRTQATAVGLAALLTVTLLAGIDQLASSPAPEALLARVQGDAAALQVVVLTARRGAAG